MLPGDAESGTRHDPLLNAVRDAATSGAVILAASERAAADLRALCRSTAPQPPQPLAPLPRILTWSAWLRSLWSSLITSGTESRLLLNSAQEQALWREVIETGPQLESLGSVDSLADLAAQAWSRLAEYVPRNLSRDLTSSASTYDTRAFVEWAAVFRTHCATRGYLTAAELPAALGTHISRGSLALPSSLLLIGFVVDPAPSHQLLQEALIAAGCNIQRHTHDASRKTKATIVHCEDAAQERSTAAHWVNHLLRSRDPDLAKLRIALIVPNLEEDRPALQTALRAILAPELQDVAADLSSAPFVFSSGNSLAESPLIATALDLLHWLAAPLDEERISALLLSPHLGSSADLAARAQFDAFRLRSAERLQPSLTLAQTVRLARRSAGSDWAEFLGDTAEAAAKFSPSTLRTFAEWTEFFRSVLRAARWPGDRPLTAQQYNAVNAWEHVLDSVATLDFAGTRIALLAALQALDRQARRASVSSPQSEALVQVFSPEEAAGVAFDAILFLHATDALWPAPAKPHPFLDWQLQRDLNMPGSAPALATREAAAITADLLSSAPEVLFFCPAADENGEQRLSSVLEGLHLPQLSADELLSPPAPAAPLTTEFVADTAPLPALPSSRVSGGARVLKLQAACAFLAAAEIRLLSAPTDSSELGFDAIESGNFVHRVMESLWSELESQQNLRNIPPQELDMLIARSVRAAIPSPRDESSPWEAEYLDLQRERLTNVVRAWLRLELERGPFTVVGKEEETEITVGPLVLRVRMDRVDMVEGGGHVFVDYKTGASVRHSQWDGERPEEPQLPLYALVSEPGDLKGIAFARLRAGQQMAWVGRQAEAGILPMARARVDDLELAVGEWRDVLSSLASDFAAGRSSIRPRNITIDCAHCAQRLLCRIDPERFLATAAADDAPEDEE